MEKPKIIMTTEQQIRLIVADELRKLKAEIAEDVAQRLAEKMRTKVGVRQ